MNVDIENSIRYHVSLMKENEIYYLSELAWEEYQKGREFYKWGRHPGTYQSIRLVKKDNFLFINDQKIDLNNAFAAFAFAAFAFAAFALVRGQLVDTKGKPLIQLVREPIIDSSDFSNLNITYQLEGSFKNFSKESSYRLNGELEENGRLGLHLHNLTEEQIARLIQVLDDMK